MIGKKNAMITNYMMIVDDVMNELAIKHSKAYKTKEEAVRRKVMNRVNAKRQYLWKTGWGTLNSARENQ